jgi:hypothetical protein
MVLLFGVVIGLVPAALAALVQRQLCSRAASGREVVEA